MARCLHPIWLKIDRRKSNRLPYSSWFYRERHLVPDMMDYVPVPCGKCINCLRNKQNAMVSRCLEESDKRGTFSFVTLTYRDDTLPIARSLWKADIHTGEISLVYPGEIVSSCEDDLFVDRAKVLSLKASYEPRYFDTDMPLMFDGEYKYFSRLTPSLNVRDVRLWIKRNRVSYQREYGEKLDFTYVVVGEMGPRTCRPHYHLAFFGLKPEQVEYFANNWKHGYTCVKNVKSVNPDGTDGFAIASRYIGKYMSKGKFDCQSVKDKSALKPRVCQSQGIGRSLVDKLRANMCCFDMFGQYDLDTFFCPSLGRCLSDTELNSIVTEIPKRLCYDSSFGFTLPVPRLFRDFVFYHFSTKKVLRCKQLKGTICPFDEDSGKAFGPYTYKTEKIPTALWLMVKARIRDDISNNVDRKFREYCSKFVFRELDVACNQFEAYNENHLLLQEKAREASYIKFLTSSKDLQ